MIKHLRIVTKRSAWLAKTCGSLFLAMMLTWDASAQKDATGSAGTVSYGTDSSVAFKPHGILWGAAFGDLDYKGNADVLNRGVNQYSGTPINTNMAQWRRIYLGYTYDISQKFTADFLLSAENDYQSGVLGQTSAGDILANNKFAPFVKWANLRWKNIWKGTDLVLGQGNTPAIGITGRNTQTSEEVWAYRSIEKTVSDIRGTPVYDMGAELQGWFDPKGNFGYDLMVANGQAARPENDQYKWFYGDVYAKFLDKRIVIDLYQDYERLNWGVYTKGPNGNWYHDRNMTKLFAAWTTPKFTAGFEGLMTTILGDVKITGKDGNTYYATTKALDMSFFVRGRILSNKKGDAKLGYFARYDNYDPSGNLDNIVNNTNTKSYTALTANYDPTTKEQFMVVGLDYTPMKNVHIMPNFWLNTYTSSVTATSANEGMNANITTNKGTDAVWRLTFYYVYGK